MSSILDCSKILSTYFDYIFYELSTIYAYVSKQDNNGECINGVCEYVFKN